MTSNVISSGDEFKKRIDYDTRLAESKRLLKAHPKTVPVLFSVYKKHVNELILPKYKYLVPKDVTVGQLLYIVRKRIKINSNQALFIFIGNSLISAGATLDIISKQHGEKDGFIYMTLSLEDTFG